MDKHLDTSIEMRNNPALIPRKPPIRCLLAPKHVIRMLEPREDPLMRIRTIECPYGGYGEAALVEDLEHHETTRIKNSKPADVHLRPLSFASIPRALDQDVRDFERERLAVGVVFQERLEYCVPLALPGANGEGDRVRERHGLVRLEGAPGSELTRDRLRTMHWEHGSA